MKERIAHSLDEAALALNSLRSNEPALANIERAACLMSACLKSGGTIFSCGNGGSMCDAMHFAEELTGKFRGDRIALAGVAISDPSHLTCVANDFGFDEVFSRYVEAHGKPGDVLLAISTSGSSANVLRAASVAQGLGMKVVALTGVEDSSLGGGCDVEIATPGGAFSDRVQELHIKVIHVLIELIESEMPG